MFFGIVLASLGMDLVCFVERPLEYLHTGTSLLAGIARGEAFVPVELQAAVTEQARPMASDVIETIDLVVTKKQLQEIAELPPVRAAMKRASVLRMGGAA